MKEGWTGLESAGKSQLIVIKALKLYRRNKHWIKKRAKLGLEYVPRTMAFDTPMSDQFIKMLNDAGLKYLFFEDINELIGLDEIDIVMHEISKHFPARGNEGLTRKQIEFLSQGAKEGVDLYFCSQDYSQVHKQFRVLVNKLHYVVKFAGSRRPTRSSPPVRFVWGFVFVWSLNPKEFAGDNTTFKKTIWDLEWYGLFWPWYWINRRDTQWYNTNYKVKGSKLPKVRMLRQKIEYVDEKGEVVDEKFQWAKA